MNTYSISLFFDEEGQDYLNDLIKQVAHVTGNNYMVDNEVPPHITLGMFKTDNTHIDGLITIVEKVAKVSGEIKLRNLEAVTFRNKLLIIKPDDCAGSLLNLLNKELHTRCLQKFSPGCNNLYIPEFFFPHIAIASGLTNIQMIKAIDYIKYKLHNVELQIKTISLARRHPYCEKFITQILQW